MNQKIECDQAELVFRRSFALYFGRNLLPLGLKPHDVLPIPNRVIIITHILEKRTKFWASRHGTRAFFRLFLCEHGFSEPGASSFQPSVGVLDPRKRPASRGSFSSECTFRI